MHPNAPPAPPPAPLPTNSKDNPYEFIIDSNHKPRRGLGSILGGGSMNTRVIIAAVFSLFLLLIGWALVSLLNGTPKGPIKELTVMAEQQNEIIRIARLGGNNATSAAAKNLAINTELVFDSAQNDTISILKKGGNNPSAKTLSLLQSSDTDNQLNSAMDNGNYDSTFISILNEKFAAYQAVAAQAFRASGSDATRESITSSYDSSKLLASN